MKLFLPCLLCLCAGFLAGLYLKPASDYYGTVEPVGPFPVAAGAPEPVVVADEAYAAEPAVADAVDVQVANSQPVPAVSPEDTIYRAHDEALVALDHLLGGAIRTESLERTRASVGRLATALGLTAEQENLVLYSAEQYMASSSLPLPVEVDAFDSPLRGEVESVLLPEQVAAYEALRERSRLNWVESQAYGELARVQGAASYTQDEKDALFAQLVEDIAAGSSE